MARKLVDIGDDKSSLADRSANLKRFAIIKRTLHHSFEVSNLGGGVARAATASYLSSASLTYPITASTNKDLVPGFVILIMSTPALPSKE